MLRVATFTALALVAIASKAGAQTAEGPRTSGGSLPYISSGQSEEEIQKKRKARADAEAERVRAEAEKTRADTVKVEPAVAPKPVETAKPVEPAKSVETVAIPEDAKKPAAIDPAKPKIARSKVVQPDPSIPPGVTLEPRTTGVAKVMPVAPMRGAPQMQQETVVVYRPLFFGVFGPSVPVRERATILVPPAPVGRTVKPYDAVPGPSYATGKPTRGMASDGCHYHAYPTGDMPFHRDIQCHWHKSPDDPSLRYMR